MNYYQFDAEALAADDHFKEWVCCPTPDLDAFWQAFLRDCPERYYQVEEARQLIIGIQAIQQPTLQPDNVDAIWTRIEHTIERSRPRAFVLGWLGDRVWQVAALVALVLGAGWFGWQQIRDHFFESKHEQAPAAWTETLNEASQLMLIQLADGSQVHLQKNSRLRYRTELSGVQREVYLTGNAFFDVKKNPKRPFVVYANGLVTEVLGTSFRINAPKDASTVTVDVKTGRVSVFANQAQPSGDPKSRGMVLTPNQKAVFHRDAATLDRALVDSPRLLVPKSELSQFIFENAPVARVLEAIERAYGVDVIFDEEVMQHCTLTLSLDDEDLFQKINVICKVLDAQYKLIDAQIVIYSKGCPQPN